MSKDYAALPRTQIRYLNRAVEDDAWIKAFLHKMPNGVLATAHDGQPFALNNLFVYVEADHAIYMHTAQVGRTQANVEAAERVCFTVSRIGRFLPYRKPVDFDVEYESVVVFGQASLIEDLAEKERVMWMLLGKYAPHLKRGVDFDPIPIEDLKRTSVYRIEIEEWSAKRNEAEPDFADAYTYKIDEE
jgi:nitroimidazol reductase NimA-like FMN-containing flavoprotein (pyridoxamine 5'-phosphate oxidase superfamily)